MYRDVSGRNIDGKNLYNEFKRKYEANKPTFDKVVANFDENGVTLKTGEEEVAGGADTNNAQQTVMGMAKKAAKNFLKK